MVRAGQVTVRAGAPAGGGGGAGGGVRGGGGAAGGGGGGSEHQRGDAPHGDPGGRERAIHYAASASNPSSTWRSLVASPSGVNGLWMNATRGPSSASSRSTWSARYPDMNRMGRSGRITTSFSATSR